MYQAPNSQVFKTQLVAPNTLLQKLFEKCLDLERKHYKKDCGSRARSILMLLSGKHSIFTEFCKQCLLSEVSKDWLCVFIKNWLVPYLVAMSSAFISLMEIVGGCAILHDSGFNKATALMAWRVMRLVD